MNYFWQEFSFFIVSAFSGLVCFATGWLFLLTFKVEKKLQTVWRSVGFLALAIAFVFFILERKMQIFGLFGVVISLFGFLSIFKGVLAEPKLSQLIVVGKSDTDKEDKDFTVGGFFKKVIFKSRELLLAIVFLVLLVVLVILISAYPETQLRQYIMSGLEVLAVVFVIATIWIQIRRLMATPADNKQMKRQNLWPLLGYIFLLFRGISLVFYRLPDLNRVWLRELTLDYSTAWQSALVFTLIAFFFLAIWAWNFIRVRIALRIYITILVIAVVVATVGSLVFSLLIFNIVETNNLQLMLQGAKTQDLILKNHSENTVFVASTMSNDSRILDGIENADHEALKEVMENYLFGSGVDTLLIYDSEGKILASPHDDREGEDIIVGVVVEEETVKEDDLLLNHALTTGEYANAFDTAAGVLTDIIITRTVYPILVEDTVIGAIDVGYKFDTAFVDYSKKRTGTDVTLYTGSKRSATTIKTDDVTRWIGSDETDQRVIDLVLTQGKVFSASVERLGEQYYSAFKPIRDLNGEIIGMVSVGTPTYILFDDVRQQLLNTFLLVTAFSILLAFIGNKAMFKLYKDRCNIQ